METSWAEQWAQKTVLSRAEKMAALMAALMAVRLVSSMAGQWVGMRDDLTAAWSENSLAAQKAASLEWKTAESMDEKSAAC